MAIHNREDLHAFATAGRPDAVATTLGRGKRRIDETLAFVNYPVLAHRIRQLGENFAQHLAFAPLLKPAMHRFVIGITLRQHVPLRARVQDPQHGFQDRARRHGLVRPGRLSGICSSGKYSRIRSHWSSRNRSMRPHCTDVYVATQPS